MPRPNSSRSGRPVPGPPDAAGGLPQPPIVAGNLAPLAASIRPAAGRRVTLPRIVMLVTAAPADPPLVPLLEAEGIQLVPCPDARALLEEVMLAVPDMVIYALRADCREDLGVLRLMRRAAPDVPLVLLAAEDSLDTRKITQSLRPVYYAVCPVDGAELRDVIRTAISRRGRTT
jgi:CheY-like chemotaxis protein